VHRSQTFRQFVNRKESRLDNFSAGTKRTADYRSPINDVDRWESRSRPGLKKRIDLNFKSSLFQQLAPDALLRLFVLSHPATRKTPRIPRVIGVSYQEQSTLLIQNDGHYADQELIVRDSHDPGTCASRKRHISPEQGDEAIERPYPHHEFDETTHNTPDRKHSQIFRSRANREVHPAPHYRLFDTQIWRGPHRLQPRVPLAPYYQVSRSTRPAERSIQKTESRKRVSHSGHSR
jgi:hypothetical protein